MRLQYRLILFLWLCCCCSLSAGAQLPLPAQPISVHYTSSNSGLPTGLIYKIIADHKGYLWLTTDKGLVRYDGNTFRLISTGRSEDFVSAFRTRDQLLWLFAYSGHTAAIDLNTQQVINTDSLYGLDRLQPPTRPYLLGLQDSGAIVLYQQGSKGKMMVYPGRHQSVFRAMNRTAVVEELLARYHLLVPGLRQELDSMFLHQAFGLSVKDSFVTIRNKIYISGIAGASLYFNGDDYGIGEYIMGFARQENDLYIGGQTIGLCRIEGYFSLPRYRQTVVSLLPGQPVNYIEKDYLENIWVSAQGNGLFLFPYKDRRTLYYNKEYSGLYSNDVTSIQRPGGGLTALGYRQAVADFYRPGFPVARYHIPVQRSLTEVLHMVQAGTAWLLFTGSEAFYARSGAGGLPGAFRHSPYQKHVGIAPGYKNGKLLHQVFYYASSNGITKSDSSGMISWHPDDRESFRQKRICLLPLADTLFYIGTIRGCYRNDKLLPYLQDEQINCLEATAGYLYIGTNTGVYTLSLSAAGRPDSLRRLIAAPCYAIRSDGEYTYLRCTSELVIVRNAGRQVVTHFSFRLYRIPFGLSDFYADSNYVTLAGNQGVFCIPRQDMIRPRLSSSPRMHVLCSLNDYSPADTVYRCPYKSNLSALFQLDILDYSNDDWAIAYRVLSNGRELYSQAGFTEGAQVNFQPPGPGTYTIEFGIRPGYDSAQRILAYTLIITPLWYQQWWCRLLLFLLLAFCLCYGLHRWYCYQIAQERRKLEQQLHLQELEAQSLFGQLKPHFIFNVLTPLQGFFLRGEKIEGLNYLDSFSQLMRGLLNGIRDKYTILQSELDFIQHYLQIQQQRFDHCFRYSITIDPSVDTGKYKVPTLLLQPVVENAIEHGIDKSGRDGHINIAVTQTEKALVITVTDNGAGLPPGFTLWGNHGLSIIAERLELLARIKGSGGFRIGPHPGGQPGTCVTLLLAKHDITKL